MAGPPAPGGEQTEDDDRGDGHHRRRNDQQHLPLLGRATGQQPGDQQQAEAGALPGQRSPRRLGLPGPAGGGHPRSTSRTTSTSRASTRTATSPVTHAAAVLTGRGWSAAIARSLRR